MIGRALGVVGLVAASFVAAPMGQAGAWTDGECTDATGVTVVIDFQELGGGVNVRCAPGPVATGFGALERAEISYQTAIRQPGFLCKIAGKPSNDPCIDTSPAAAYWSYWLAPRGGQWCYSNWGAGNRTPPPGSVEGWSFSKDKGSSQSPSPRYAVPAPIPGAATSLPANDCDSSSTAPVASPPPTTKAPTTAAPGTAPVATNAPPTTAAPGKPGAVVGGVTIVPGRRTVPTTVPGTPTTVAVAGETTLAPATDTSVADTAVVEATTGPTTSTSPDTERELASSAKGTVDLSDDGVDDSSPVGIIVAVAIVVVLGGGALVRARRSTARTVTP